MYGPLKTSHGLNKKKKKKRILGVCLDYIFSSHASSCEWKIFPFHVVDNKEKQYFVRRHVNHEKQKINAKSPTGLIDGREPIKFKYHSTILYGVDVRLYHFIPFEKPNIRERHSLLVHTLVSINFRPTFEAPGSPFPLRTDSQ